MIAILINCITLGSYQPCYDTKCESNRCQWLKLFDHVIFLFFFMEMLIKMVAMGVSQAPQAYLADYWNRLDCFIVIAGGLEYVLDIGNVNLTAIRTVRVLRPLRAINRIPSMRILVTLLLDTLPMLGNVLLLCFFVFFIFGIIGVQLWSGLLRQRCFISLPTNVTKPSYVPSYYRLPTSDKEYLCSTTKDNGLHRCQDLAPLRSHDLSTVCQNTLPTNWRPLSPNGSRYEDRFIDGELVPYDLVPGDESSPFLVKQMSPLIAQSVFQPAYAPRHLDSLPSIRQRRHTSGRATDSRYGRSSSGDGQQRRPMPSASNNNIGDNNDDDPDNQSKPIELMVETNSNSDQFDSISQLELSKSDKSSRKYYMRKKNNKGACINWNKYYTECRAGDTNPFQGTISFDNVGMAWTTIFLVISLEGWSDIMYLLQDSHSFWVWIYFVLLIVIGSFFMINLCLVVIATQFSATKKREMERMRQERLKFSSSSTLTATSESTNCYTVIIKSIARALRHAKIALVTALKRRKCARLHRRRLRQRQLHVESYQVTGLARDGGKAETRGAGKRGGLESDSLGDSGKVVSAGWEQGSGGTATAVEIGVRTPGGPHSDEEPERNLKRLASSSKRSIRLDRAPCGAPGCRHAANHSKKLATNVPSLNRSPGKKDLHSTCRHYHECEMDNIEIAFCPKFINNNLSLQNFRKRFNERVRQLVDHRYFQRLILLAILINAISMGIEYHNQPEQLTEAVEISNIVFAYLFLVEMILKLIAHGLYDYVIDGFNCFDGCIVILSILELFESSSGGSGLSVLRTFRLLRILKLVRFMPALRRQLVIMLRTLDNVAIFFALLVLFIFIFSILGMNLFGCKFCETLPDNTERCDRKNFNSLLWSLVTVFQILTQEDWNVVLFNGMEKTSHWAALYFVLLMTFGNYVLFNLLVAILVEGFSQEDDFKVSSSSSYTTNKSASNHPPPPAANRTMIESRDGSPNWPLEPDKADSLIYRPGPISVGIIAHKINTSKSFNYTPAIGSSDRSHLDRLDDKREENDDCDKLESYRTQLSTSTPQLNEAGTKNEAHLIKTTSSNLSDEYLKSPGHVCMHWSSKDQSSRNDDCQEARAICLCCRDLEACTSCGLGKLGTTSGTTAGAHNRKQQLQTMTVVGKAGSGGKLPSGGGGENSAAAADVIRVGEQPHAAAIDNSTSSCQDTTRLMATTATSSSSGSGIKICNPTNATLQSIDQRKQTGAGGDYKQVGPGFSLGEAGDGANRTRQNQQPVQMRNWNYGQLVTSMDSTAGYPSNLQASNHSSAYFGIRRPPKRLVYFYDVNDDISDEIDFLTKSLETKSYATSMMGQHDHYLDNIAKSQAAAAKARAANKLQAQHRINLNRAAAIQAQLEAANERQTLAGKGEAGEQQPPRKRSNFRLRSLGSSEAANAPPVAGPSGAAADRDAATSGGSTSSWQAPRQSSSKQQQQRRESLERLYNLELFLSPHWASLPSHLNKASLAMMRYYQSSYTYNFYNGKRERALLNERGQFDKSCCRVDWDAYSKALNTFADQSDDLNTQLTDGEPSAPTMGCYQNILLDPNRDHPATTEPNNSRQLLEVNGSPDINLSVIYEPFKLFPSMSGVGATGTSRPTDLINKGTAHLMANSIVHMLGGQQADPKPQPPKLNRWQRELLVSLENYAKAMARWHTKQSLRKRLQDEANSVCLASSASNINRTTQAIRRGSVVILNKLKLLHSQNLESTTTLASSSQNARAPFQDQSDANQMAPMSSKSVPRLSLTKAESVLNESFERSSNKSPVERSGDVVTRDGFGDMDVAIHMSSMDSIVGPYADGRSSPNKGASAGMGFQHTATSGATNTAPDMFHLDQPHSSALPLFGRHSIANLPLRPLVDNAVKNSFDEPLRPKCFTPNPSKRPLSRPSLTGWFSNRSQGSNRNSCYSQASKATTVLTDKCTKLLRPNLLRRRSFSGPFEWLQREHRPPYDMMLVPTKKQTSKKLLKKMKPQKSNCSDFHSLNNRRVYKLDSRGFQTKLCGVFYVITHDPLMLNSGAASQVSTVAIGAVRNTDQSNSAYEGSGGGGGGGGSLIMVADKEILSSNEAESSFFNTSNEDNNSDGRPQSRTTTTGCRSNYSIHNNQLQQQAPQRRTFLVYFYWTRWMIQRRHYSLFIFSPQSRIRRLCLAITSRKEFDYFVLFFISMNCVTLAMERPKIPPWSKEREFLTVANYYFTFMFTLEMALKVIAKGLYYGKDAYLSDSWNIMDGSLVGFSLFDLILSFVADRSPRIFAILRVFRLLRSLRPLRVINRLMGLKLVVQTLLLSLRPIGNIVLICCTFFIIFGILGVQLFKGTFYYCDGPDPLDIMRNVHTKEDCFVDHRNRWVNRKYNFDNLGQALMALFVLSSKDGWVNIMYTGLDAVGVDMQPRENYNEWRLIYFISFLLLVAFFVLNMFVGVVVENFHRCRKEQELEEKARRAEKRQRKLDKRRRKLREPPYYSNYGKFRLLLHKWVTGGYFDLLIAAVIGFNVIFMSLEHYQMPYELIHLLKVSNYVFTVAFILEAGIKSTALGMRRYLKDRWNQLDVLIVAMSIIGIIFEEMDSFTLPINPTLLRVLRVMRIARVLKLLKMAKGIRALLDTVMQALPQVGNLGLLFFLLFFIFAALGVELFGRLECNDDYPCSGLMDQHAHFQNFGLAFLTLFRVATGDNWNGIMKDTLRDKCDPSSDCLKNCCVSQIIAPLYFVVFVLLAQFVLVNVVVAVLMKHLEESHHEMEIDEEYELDKQLAEELEAKKKALLEARERQNLYWI